MADLLTLGAQGVITAQRQLNTTGHNIANANTKGYSKQSVEQSTNEPYSLGGKPWGGGVHAEEIYRKYDKFAISEFNIATSLNSHAATRNAKATILDEMMAHSGKKIPDNMNQFFGSLKALVDIPNDMGARKQVLQHAKIVSDSLNSIDGILQNQKNDTADEIKVSVQRINDIGRELAEIHKTLLGSDGENNDLLDTQQRLINELSEHTQVTVHQRNSDSYNILIGTGHTLVSGVNANTLTTIPNSFDTQKLELALVTDKSIKQISNEDIRGKLGALFEYRDKSLKRMRDEIGLLAISFAIKLNELQSQGYDLKGEVGKNIYRDLNDSEIAFNRVLKNANSNADIHVFIDDINQLKLGDYELTFDGSQYQVLDPDREVIQVTATGTPPSINIDGLNIQINKGLAAEERVIIRAMEDAAGQIYTEMTEASEIAAQGFVTSNSELNGAVKLKKLAQGAQEKFQIVFSADASEFSVLDMDGNVLLAPQAYLPNNKVLVNGTEFELKKGAKGNDRFVISLTLADGDNSNLLRMQALQTQKMLHQGRSTIVDIFEKLSSDIGIEKASFERLASISQTELDAAKGRVAEISGVNLDEEAANMMKFQQAYMASSRIMSAANEAFETLLNI